MFRILFAHLLLSLFLPLQAQDSDPVNGNPIEVEAVTTDAAIKNRIREIYTAVGGFEDVEVSVESGVVTLSGKIGSEDLRNDAVSLANRTAGVVLTLDRMKEPEEITSQLAPAYEKIREMGRTFVVKLPLIGAALVVLVLGYLISRFFKNQGGWLDRWDFSTLGKQLALRIVRLAILLVAIVTALELLDATAIVGAIVGAAGLAGLALGFAFQNIVENYLAGVLLSTRNPLRRFDFMVGVSTDFDLAEIKRIAMENLRENPAVLPDPPPMVIVDSLGDSSVMMRLFGWVDQKNHDFLKSKSESIRLIKEAFDEAGIEMPEPIYRVHLRERPTAIIATAGTSNDSVRSSNKAVHESDLTPDNTIDDQIKSEAGGYVEENLLTETKLDKK